MISDEELEQISFKNLMQDVIFLHNRGLEECMAENTPVFLQLVKDFGVKTWISCFICDRIIYLSNYLHDNMLGSNNIRFMEHNITLLKVWTSKHTKILCCPCRSLLEGLKHRFEMSEQLNNPRMLVSFLKVMPSNYRDFYKILEEKGLLWLLD